MNLRAQDGRALNPVQIENELLRLGQELEEITEKMGEQGEAVGRWEVAYKRAKARARLQSVEKNDGARDAYATLQSITEFEAWRVGDSVYSAMRDRSFTIRVQIEILRSLAANVRHQSG